MDKTEAELNDDIPGEGGDFRRAQRAMVKPDLIEAAIGMRRRFSTDKPHRFCQAWRLKTAATTTGLQWGENFTIRVIAAPDP